MDTYIAKQGLNYRISDLFMDYGLIKLVMITRKKMEELGTARNRTNSIIKEPFESFPENKIIMKLTGLVAKWLRNVEKE